MKFSIRKTTLRNAVTAIVAVLLLLLVPLWPEPAGIPFSVIESGQFLSKEIHPQIPSLLQIQKAKAQCPKECQIKVCVWWIPGPSDDCPNPGPGGGCCEQQDIECDDGCANPPPSYFPPKVSSAVVCSKKGVNGWCAGTASLQVTATDPQAFAVTITGSNPTMNCTISDGSGTCTKSLPIGNGTAAYTAESAVSGMTASGSRVWKRDPNAPLILQSLTGGTPSGGWYDTNVTFTASASDAVSGMSSFVIEDNGAAVSSPVLIDEGLHTIIVTARDVAGNIATSAFTLGVDTIAPTISKSLSTSPSGGWYTDAPILTVSASDAGSGVASISIKDNGISIANGATLADGLHTVTITAADVAGNTSVSTFNLKVDTTPPLITPSFGGTPAGGWYRAALPFTATASDSISGLSSFVIQDNGLMIASPALLGEGLHSITMTATDNAGNVTTSSVTLQVDVTAPAISKSLSTSPSTTGWHTAAPLLTITGSDSTSGVAVISITDNGAPISNPSTLAEGIHNIAVSLNDVAGNSSASIFTVKVDPTQPAITPDLTGTQGDHGWYVSAVDVNAAITDATSGVASTSALLNGTAYTFPNTITDDGEHVVIFNASDVAGNALSQYSIVKVDRTQPLMDVTRNGDAGSNGWYRSDVDFQISATDVTSGPQYGEYRLDGGVWKTGMIFTVSGDGTHTVEYRVFDNAGNVTTQTETVLIDTVVPEVSFLAPSQNTPVDKVARISGTSADTGTSGLDVVEVSVDGGASWHPVSLGAWAYDWNVAGLSNGTRSVSVRARDIAGNISSTENLNLLVDTSGPRISIADTWTFDLAGELNIIPDVYDVQTVSVTVTNSDGTLMTSHQYTDDIPSIVWWDGRYHGQQQPAGDYVIVVTACDVHGVCSTARSTIVIPAFYYETPVYPPQGIVPAPPIILPTPAPVEIPKPVVVLNPSTSTVRRTSAALLLFVSAALGLLFLGNAMFDPRPKAIHSLAGTIRKNIKE